MKIYPNLIQNGYGQTKINFESEKIYPLPIIMASVIWYKNDAPMHINGFIDKLKSFGILGIVVDIDDDIHVNKCKLQKSDMIIDSNEIGHYELIKPYIGLIPVIDIDAMMKLLFNTKENEI